MDIGCEGGGFKGFFGLHFSLGSRTGYKGV